MMLELLKLVLTYTSLSCFKEKKVSLNPPKRIMGIRFITYNYLSRIQILIKFFSFWIEKQNKEKHQDK